MSTMENYMPPKELISLLANQCGRSGIRSVDILQYAVTAEWLINRYGNINELTLPEDCIEWLELETGFRDEQRVKAVYIANLILDHQAKRFSKACPNFQITCLCGNLIGRTDDSHRYPMYRCSCGAAVGIHRGDGWPLGLPASKPVREYRKVLHNTHEQLCVLWGVNSKSGYKHLAKLLGVPLNGCHFSLVVSEERALEINAIMEQEIFRLKALRKSINTNDHHPHQLDMAIAH